METGDRDRMQKTRIWDRAEAFFHAWLEERNSEAAAEFLTEDVCFLGAGRGEQASGRAEMTDHIRRDVKSGKAPFACRMEPVCQQELAGDLCQLSLRLELENALFRRERCVFLILRKEADGQWRICSLNISEASRSRPAEMRETGAATAGEIARVRHELLNDSIAGGMMGGYLEPGFPFYFINRRMLDYLGYQNEDEFVAAIGGRMQSAIHPDDQAAADASVQQQLKTGDEYAVEYRMRKRDGSYIWVHDTGRKLRAEDGRDAIMSVCVDISGMKQLQERIQAKYEQEIRYFSDLSSAEGAIQGRLNLTRDRVETYMAPPELAITQPGGSYGAAIRALAGSAVDPERQDEIGETLQPERVRADFEEGKRDYHFQFLRRRADGQLFWSRTSLRTAQNPETGDLMLFFYTADVTERYLQQELLDRLVEQNYDNIIEVDMEQGTHRFIAYKRNGRTRLPDTVSFEEAVRRMAENHMEGAAREEYREKLSFGYMRRRLQETGVYSFTAELRDIGGELRVKQYQVFYINRALDRACVTRSDVTELVRREQKQRDELSVALLAAEQANAAKTNFLSRMSHEIRTPMNAIIGMTTIAAQALGDDEMVSECLSKIGISSRFLLSLINDILDMSRIESGKMLLKNEAIPTEEFINGVNAICYGQAENKGVAYECIVDPVLDDYYMGDAMKLQQVLINILSNAIKFTEPGGTVTLSIQQRNRKKDSALLRFIVNDTGVGMSEEFLPHIFEAFSQESTGTTALYSGTGLGLAISKNIVDLMGGKITVRSIKGVGTEFTVDVTLGLSEREKLRHGRQKEAPNFSRLKTLVVDDDVMVCEGAVLTLKEIGIQAEWVDSGRKAVEQVSKLWSSGIYYDMILIDWKMPEMDGIETARRIRAIVGREVTIIIMTAYDWGAIEHEAKLAGVNLLMSKPMFKSSLISAFTKVLGEKEEEEQAEKPVEFDFTGKRVLLAEDNAINTEVAVMLLKSKGFEVETAKNGLRALELFSKSEPGYYSAILMDIRMPLMDGLTAATSIRHLSNQDAGTIPIIAMTANAFDDDVDKSKAAGMNAHLSKPIDPQRLYQTLYDFISAREGISE